MNKHIADYLDKYLKLKEPDFAVMIKGEWGSGKTYFIKKYLEKGEYKEKFYYISLNGLSTMADVSAILLSEKIFKKNIKSFTKNISTISFSKFGLTLNASSLLHIESFLNFLKGKIFVFDDFERSKIDKMELLGFFSTLIEINKHVIVICNEKVLLKPSIENNQNISNMTDVEYRNRKEKVFGKTLEIEPLDKEVISQIIENVEFVWLKELLCQFEDIIELNSKILNYVGRSTSNYRVIEHAIQEFAFVFDSFFYSQELVEYHQKIFDELFSRFFPIFCCVEFGKIDINNDIDKYFKPSFLNNENNENNEILIFKKTFNGFGLDTFLPLKMWIDVFKFSKIDKAQLVNEIGPLYLDEDENWEKLWRCYDYEDNEILKLYDAVTLDIKNMKYRNVCSIIHSFSTMMDLANNNVIDKTVDDILIESKWYLDKLGNDLEWDEVHEKISQWDDACGKYGYHASDLPQFKMLLDYVKRKISNKAKNNRYIIYKEFLNSLETKVNLNQKILDDKYRYGDVFSVRKMQD